MNNKPDEHFGEGEVWPPPIARAPDQMERISHRPWGLWALGLVGLETVIYCVLCFCAPTSSTPLPVSVPCLLSLLPMAAIALGTVRPRSWQGVTAIVLAAAILLFVWWLYAVSYVWASL